MDYLHVSLMDVHSQTREGKYTGEERIKLLHGWINGRMLSLVLDPSLLQEALEAIESPYIEMIALGRELIDHNFVNKIVNGKDETIISEFDEDRQDKHDLPPKLWKRLNDDFYPVPRKTVKLTHNIGICPHVSTMF